MAILSTSGVLRIRSGDAAGHQAHEVEGVGFGLQPPCQAGPGLEAAKPVLKPVGGGGYLGVSLAAHQIVPAFHEVPGRGPPPARPATGWRRSPCSPAGQEAGQAPETDTVHVQVGHQLPEGLWPLAGGHVGRQGRGASPALSVAHLGVTLAAARGARADRAKMSQKEICLGFAGSLCS